MKFTLILATIFALSAPVFATPRSQSRDNKPSPKLPFTIAAFQSPYPDATDGHLTGLKLRAYNGGFWFTRNDTTLTLDCDHITSKTCPPGPEAVFWVDSDGRSWLDSTNPQPVYLKTANGVLGYLPKGKKDFPSGAMAESFRHLGINPKGLVSVPSAQNPSFVNQGPSTFNWVGSDNNYWFLCPIPGPGYKVVKYVNEESVNGCTAASLIALDYTGARPAAGEYM